MPDDTPDSGFRSLVQKIQENDGDAAERGRPPRRRLTMPGGRRPAAPAEAAPKPAAPTGEPLRLLERRWL